MNVVRPQRVYALLAAAALFAGCNATDDRVESRLRSELPKVIGPADRYEVDVEGVDNDASSADRVTVVGYGIHPRHGPVIDRLNLELRGIRYDRKLKRLDRAESAQATAWVSAADLSDFLETQDGIRAANVTLQAPDSVFIRIRPDLGGLPVPPGANLEMVGTLEGRGPYVEYDVSDVNALGGHLGDAVTKRLTRLINPLVDLSDLPMRLDVRSVRVEGRTLRLEADGDALSVRP